MRALILFACAVSVYAQCPTGMTQVSDTIYAPAGGRAMQGTVTILPSVPILGVNGASYGRVPDIVSVSKGVFSECLAPNDTATPSGSTYQVRFQHTDKQGSATWYETWLVPTSGMAVAIGPMRQSISPVSGSQFPAADITGGGTGQCVGSPTGLTSAWMYCGGLTWYAQSFTAATSITITAAQHRFGDPNLIVFCAGVAECGGVNVSTTTAAVTVTFTAAQTGTVYIADGPSYVATFTSATTAPIPALGRAIDQIAYAACYDAAGNQFGAGQITSSAADSGIGGAQGSNFAVALGTPAQTGRCVFLLGGHS